MLLDQVIYILHYYITKPLLKTSYKSQQCFKHLFIDGFKCPTIWMLNVGTHQGTILRLVLKKIIVRDRRGPNSRGSCVTSLNFKLPCQCFVVFYQRLMLLLVIERQSFVLLQFHFMWCYFFTRIYPGSTSPNWFELCFSPHVYCSCD